MTERDKEKDTQQKSEHRLDLAIKQLPLEIMPERDLWAQLQQHLPERSEFSPASALSTEPPLYRKIFKQRIAALLVLSLAGLLGWRLMLLPETQESNDQALNEPLAEFSLDEQYRASFQPISEQFGNWQHQLNIWEDATEQVRMALSFYPEEPVLLSQLSSLYQQQMNYVQLISSVDTQQLMGEAL